MPFTVNTIISLHFVTERLILCTTFLVMKWHVINIEIVFTHSIINASEYRLLITCFYNVLLHKSERLFFLENITSLSTFYRNAQNYPNASSAGFKLFFILTMYVDCTGITNTQQPRIKNQMTLSLT